MKKTIKKIAAFFLVCAIMLGSISICALANENNSEQITTESVTWSFDSTTGKLIISGTGEMDNYMFAQKPWAQYTSQITQIVINEGITSIGASAFSNCTNLVNITIPSSIMYIGAFAFTGCNSIQTLFLQYGITQIGHDAFKNCSALISINIPSSVTSIDYGAFDGCSMLSSINIPASVTSIGSGTFRGCNSLSSVSVNAGNSIYDSRDNCNGIVLKNGNVLVFGCKDTVIPNSVVSVGDYAFSGITSLTKINIPSSINNIGTGAFSNCTSLSNVYYMGTLADRNNITIGDNNNCLTDATWHYQGCVHSLTHRELVEPTYTREGCIEYWICPKCGKYFSDAAGKNEITQAQTIIPKKEVPSIEGKFSDVNKGDWFYDSVAFVNATGIMTGQGGTSNFAPAQSLQRQEFANILWRLAGEPSATYEAKFPDVPNGTWFTTPIMWAYKNGVITGYATGNFGVGDNVTREQFATMLYRYAKEIAGIAMTGAVDISSYPDAGNVSPWALEAMQWAVGNGIITGKQGVYLDPAGNAARCEGAAMIQRFMVKFGL